MMQKTKLLFLFLIPCGAIYAQSWKDSLRVGQQLYKNGEFKQAYKTLLEAQKSAPGDIDLSQDIGNAAYRSGNYEMSEKAFHSAIIKNKSNDSDLLSKYWHNAGNSQMQAQKYQEAVESYKNALRNNPNSESTRYNLAEAQRMLKQQQNSNKNKEQQQQSSDENNKSENKNQSQEQNENTQNQSQDAQSPQNDQKNNNDTSEQESKLSARKTERVLDDLLKQEIQTQKKIRGKDYNINKQAVKSGKQW